MNFNRYITEAEFSELAAFIRREGVVRRFARGERLSGQGLRSHRCGLVVQGAFRYVHADAAGEEHVVGYAFAGEFVGDYISMCVDAPSQVTIEAMCGAAALVVTGGRLEAFYRTDAAHERLGRTMAAPALSGETLATLEEAFGSLRAEELRQRGELRLGDMPVEIHAVKIPKFARSAQTLPAFFAPAARCTRTP